MTDKKHTKEPWRISDDPDYPEAVILTDETIIADANIFGANSSKKKNMANAKRIVECVNACAGIENPLDLRRQRDELREALEKIALIREEDSEKYVVKADQIAHESLERVRKAGGI